MSVPQDPSRLYAPEGDRALPVLQVSELVAELRETLWSAYGEFLVEGEVASLHRSRPGHVYFDLCDPDGQLRSVMFRREADAVPFPVEEGMQVRALARLDLYAPRGTLQLVVRALEPRGEGALRIAYEQLKRRLAEEGLFDDAHKRPLPRYPYRIGLVTSLAGAALHDFVRGLRRRQAALELCLFDARVQGDDAWRELVRGLHLLDADPRIEVIVLSRGGGSLEDLWNFNREELVRAIFELETPVVSAVGHEVDLVLSDLVADVRAATPTAAAELVVPDAGMLRQKVDVLRRRLLQRQRGGLRELGHRLESLRRGLVHPAERLAGYARRLRDANARLGLAMVGERERRSARVESLGARLHALSPLAVLERGYGIARRDVDGVILRAATDVDVGDAVRVRLHSGGLRATVTDRLPPGADGEGA